ncbi:hypothetical protein [Aquabacterium sp. J223]|uniref:hypothetical protein n=1 Tax=Aquabacterium sp. J223 TaxID=2898431 RepID=UPI0021ADE033|nr:hypothetical protein [Aquabacterium sp. J223]UUX96746.1 hypothetical protein LRS07_05535 [Aquabacterium sp. J223]
MPDRYEKTAEGRAEIGARGAELSRTTRNLLLVIDGSKPATDWLAMIAGAGPADLDALIQRGLIAPAARPAGAAHTPASAAVDVEARLQALGRDGLYALVTREARRRLGLVNGLRLVLDLEKCGTEAEIRALALRFVTQVRQTQGEAAVREVLGVGR